MHLSMMARMLPAASPALWQLLASVASEHGVSGRHLQQGGAGVAVRDATGDARMPETAGTGYHLAAAGRRPAGRDAV